MIAKKTFMLFLALFTTALTWADTILTADGSTVSTTTTWTTGTVKVTGNGTIAFSQRIIIDGNVTLHLGAGTTLIASKGIELAEGNTLTIEGTGKLTAQGENGKSGIGSLYYGHLIINNGDITATGGSGAAGIGGDEFTYEMGHVGSAHDVSGNNIGYIESTPWHYELYSMGNYTMKYYDNGTYCAEWNNNGDFQIKMGYYYGIEHGVELDTKNYAADYKYIKTGSAQYGYIGVNGWTEEPITQYYIVEDWYAEPNPRYLGKDFGTYTVDGATYTIYANLREHEYSPIGTSNFLQIFSVRETPRQQGHIDLSAHFKKWNELFYGQTELLPTSTNDTKNTTMKFGKPIEVKFFCEAGGGATGSIDYTFFHLTEDGSCGTTINGGTVNAAGGEGADAIGAGSNSPVAGVLALGTGMTIYGGDSENPTENEVTGAIDDVTTRYRYMSTTLPTPNTYNITYVLNGGTNNASNPDQYTVGEVVVFADPTYTGYTFDGWYNNPEFTDSPVTGIAADETGDKTFYAKWIKTVSNPTIFLSPATFVFDGTAKKPTVIVKDGNTVIPASEYKVSYSANKNIGTAKVTISNKSGGDYMVSGSASFTITPSTANKFGDLNGDDKVDAADIVKLSNIILE